MALNILKFNHLASLGFKGLITSRWTRRLMKYTVFQKKTPTHIVGYKLRYSCLILIIVDVEIHDII